MPSTTVGLYDLPFYAYHGVYPEEATLGGPYRVSVTCQLDSPAVGTTDALAETLDYAAAYRVIAHEMATPRKLIETVARRIAEGVLALDPRLLQVTCTVDKLAPPLGALGGYARCIYTAQRAG
ncbi:MAG: dihydroneopterin aldolase [Bacteroidia bacterium]|nr:dihydroneopterin aldolase [Bacteroidia bacterium]